MKKLFLALVLLPLSAAAQTLPAGCYAAFYQNPYAVNCFTGADAGNYGYSPSDRLYFYGITVAGLMGSFESYYLQNQSCQSSYSSLLSDYNNNESNRQQWITYGNSQAALLATETTKRKKADALVAKLRKACGSKCKKIK